MKEVLWILIWSVGWIPWFAFGLWWEERSKRKRARRKAERTIPQSLRDSSLYTREPWVNESYAQRLMREDSIRRILHEPVNITKPIRKVKRDSKTCFGKSNLCIACGVLASEDAQKLWEA